MRRAVLLLLLSITTPVFAKSLHWPEVNIQARLDAEGRLHVIERQTMVFDGDWNGGERVFNLRDSQSFRFVSLHRIDESGSLRLHLPVLLALALFIIALAKLAIDLLRTPESPQRIAVRRRLAAAKRYFATQLRTQDPRLQNEWLPYLLAFGLGSNVDRWFRRYGSVDEIVTVGSVASTSMASSWAASSTPRWSGGGGAFGGAGATGGWAVAAGAMASGVSAPSTTGSGSSGGSSSTSSSSSSSGGGSTGGW